MLSCCSYGMLPGPTSAIEVARTEYLKGLVCFRRAFVSAWTLVSGDVAGLPLESVKLKGVKRRGVSKRLSTDVEPMDVAAIARRRLERGSPLPVEYAPEAKGLVSCGRYHGGSIRTGGHVQNSRRMSCKFSQLSHLLGVRCQKGIDEVGKEEFLLPLGNSTR